MITGRQLRRPLYCNFFLVPDDAAAASAPFPLLPTVLMLLLNSNRVHPGRDNDICFDWNYFSWRWWMLRLNIIVSRATVSPPASHCAVLDWSALSWAKFFGKLSWVEYDRRPCFVHLCERAAMGFKIRVLSTKLNLISFMVTFAAICFYGSDRIISFFFCLFVCLLLLPSYRTAPFRTFQKCHSALFQSFQLVGRAVGWDKRRPLLSPHGQQCG